MISLYGLFILLLTAGSIHAQGNTDDDDGANQPSGSKDVPKKDTGLPQGVHPSRLAEALQESRTPDQNGASSSVDRQPRKECKGLRWLRKTSKPCPQQQSPPEPQPFTLYGPPQSDEMSLPAIVEESEVESYKNTWGTDEYRKFTEEEARHFKSEYSPEKKLGEGGSGEVFLATRKSDGRKVAYKSIPESDVDDYALEPSPPPICHPPTPLVPSKETSVEQCMPSRPPNSLVPYEFLLHMYLSRPGYENPHVPMALDYIILEDEFILAMEYIGGSWMTLAKYLKKKRRLGIVKAQHIIREIVKVVISLKRQGVVHGDLNGMSQ
ncbi:hypothetical protein BASA62_003153 [Batrachochytrium salamandrivorans]|nr:hypothetical protein BASA62_003153 [Batrachochytrium salamandrivorans]